GMNMASGGMNMPSMPNMNMGNMPNMTMSGSSLPGMKPDLNDITYDAFLANDRTLADPQVVDVGKNADVRLRVINGASSTNFWVDLGALSGTLLSVDGNPVMALQASQFPLAIAQRCDILVRVAEQAVPVLARGEGRTLQSGVILRPPGATVAKIANDG